MWADKKLAKRYSEALFTLAAERNQLSEVANLLQKISAALWQNNVIRKLICSAAAPKHKKNKFFLPLVNKLADNKLLVSFCILLARNNRIHLLQDIERFFDQKLSLERGEMTITLTSAFTFSPELKNSLVQELSNIYQKEIKLSAKADKTLLAGFKLRIGSSELDFSMAAKLRNLRSTLLKTQVNIQSINNL
jgi:F-type H+-transporting ATPase subunit delta